MKLHSILPHPSISNFVSKIVAIEDCKLSFDVGLPLFANGYPGFAFQTASSELISESTRKIDNLFLFGQTITPVKLYTPDRLTFIAYFLYPHTLKMLFGCSAKELADTTIDLNFLEPAKRMNLKEQLLNATAMDIRLNIMNSFVVKLIESNCTDAQKSILFATQALRRSKGLAPLTAIQKELAISERTFRRLFDLYVGISPKMFGRICQFDSAVQQLTGNHFTKLGDVAYDNGYADQSHLIRSFKEFTYLSPSEYLKKCSDFQILNM